MSIGETLARARHQAGLTIAEVSQRTRIRQRLIQGIEADDFSECGGDFYTRGHIRSIARAVGIDPEPLIGEYDRVWRAPDPLAGVRDLVTASRAALPDPGDRGEDPAEDPGPPPGGPGGPATGSGQPGGGHRQPGTMFRRPPMAPRRPRVNWTLALALALVVAVGLAGFRLLSGGGPAAPAAARSGSPAAGVPAAQGGGTPERQPAAAGSSAVPAASSPAPTAARGPVRRSRISITKRSAIFFPTPGKRVKRLLSPSRTVSTKSSTDVPERMVKASLAPTPLTLIRLRNNWRSAWEAKPNSKWASSRTARWVTNVTPSPTAGSV